jgi:hypothetical protein
MATLPGVSAVHVGPAGDCLKILGIDTLLGNASPVRIEVKGPAAITIKSASATIAFILGNRAEVVDRALYATYFFSDTPFPAERDEEHDREHRFFDLARAIHRHGHGGTLLVLDGDASSLPPDMGSSTEPHFLLTRPFDGLREIDEEQTGIGDAMRSTATAAEAQALFHKLRVSEVFHSQYVAGLAQIVRCSRTKTHRYRTSSV